MSSGHADPRIRARGVGKDYVTNKASGPGLRAVLRGLVAPERVRRQALIDVDLTVERGELVTLLGPNGAGKSTLIKVLTGVVGATSGEVRVAGLDPRADRIAHSRNIGVVFGQRSQLWWDLPVRQSFAILADIYGLPPAVLARKLDEFDAILDLSPFWDTRMRQLSLGQRVRADLAGALLHSPDVIFLDEPTIGMDVVAKDQVRRFLRREVAERGASVLLTTHDMNEVKRLARRVVVINHGRIVADGDIETMVRDFGATFRIRVGLRHARAPIDVPGLRLLGREGSEVTLGPDRTPPKAVPLTVQEALGRVVRTLDVESVSVEEDDLEDVMRGVFRSVLPVGTDRD